MSSLATTRGYALICFLAATSCKKDDASGKTPGASTGVANATVGAAAPSVGTTVSAEPTEPIKEVCPLPRRCTDACKKAALAATNVCGPQWETLQKELPNTQEIGACTARCLANANTFACVGAATSEECECARKCTDGISQAMKAKREPYLGCYAKVIAAACY